MKRYVFKDFISVTLIGSIHCHYTQLHRFSYTFVRPRYQHTEERDINKLATKYIPAEKNHLDKIMLTNSYNQHPQMSYGIIDFSVSINICLLDHFINLRIRQLLTYISTPRTSEAAVPIEVMTCLNSAAEIFPSPFLSKTLNASLISSSESVSFILRAIMVRNSGKSISPFPSESTSLIISCNSASVGFWPRERMTTRLSREKAENTSA
jgi:hypothetical protein